MEQLIVSILDDPSIDRVMRAAGFSISQVRGGVEGVAILSYYTRRDQKGAWVLPVEVRVLLIPDFRGGGSSRLLCVVDMEAGRAGGAPIGFFAAVRQWWGRISARGEGKRAAVLVAWGGDGEPGGGAGVR